MTATPELASYYGERQARRRAEAAEWDRRVYELRMSLPEGQRSFPDVTVEDFRMRSA